MQTEELAKVGLNRTIPTRERIAEALQAVRRIAEEIERCGMAQHVRGMVGDLLRPDHEWRGGGTLNNWYTALVATNDPDKLTRGRIQKLMECVGLLMDRKRKPDADAPEKLRWFADRLAEAAGIATAERASARPATQTIWLNPDGTLAELRQDPSISVVEFDNRQPGAVPWPTASLPTQERAAAPIATADGEAAPTKERDDLFPSGAFHPYATSNALANAAKAGHIYREKRNGRWFYSWSDAHRNWPQNVPADPPTPKRQ